MFVAIDLAIQFIMFLSTKLKYKNDHLMHLFYDLEEVAQCYHIRVEEQYQEN